MGRSIRDSTGNRAGKGFGQAHGRGVFRAPWDQENPDQDPSSDVRDIYEDQQDSGSGEYVWPENETREDED
jgi:hypothetical protein